MVMMMSDGLLMLKIYLALTERFIKELVEWRLIN